jgi:hypothetical protein
MSRQLEQVPCPYCKVTYTRAGLVGHVRMKHEGKAPPVHSRKDVAAKLAPVEDAIPSSSSSNEPEPAIQPPAPTPPPEPKRVSWLDMDILDE